MPDLRPDDIAIPDSEAPAAFLREQAVALQHRAKGVMGGTTLGDFTSWLKEVFASPEIRRSTASLLAGAAA